MTEAGIPRNRGSGTDFRDDFFNGFGIIAIKEHATNDGGNDDHENQYKHEIMSGTETERQARWRWDEEIICPQPTCYGRKPRQH